MKFMSVTNDLSIPSARSILNPFCFKIFFCTAIIQKSLMTDPKPRNLLLISKNETLQMFHLDTVQRLLYLYGINKNPRYTIRNRILGLGNKINHPNRYEFLRESPRFTRGQRVVF